MKLTAGLRERLLQAKQDGYARIYRIAGSYRATTYCAFHNIDRLLEYEDGHDFGSARPRPQANMWTDHPNTREVDPHRDIMYSSLFAKYPAMQNWVVGDTPEACIPLGNQTAEQHGLPNAVKVVRARTAEEACK